MNFKTTVRVLICTLVMSVYADIHCQVRVAIQPGFNNFGGEMQLMTDGSIRILCIAAEDFGYGTAFVSTVHLSKTGELISTKMHQELSYEVAWELQSLPMHNGSTIVIASLSGCDYGIPVTLGKITSDGDVAWSIRPEESEIYGGLAYGQQVTDTLFYVTDGLHESYFSTGGKMVSKPTQYVLFDRVSLTANGYMASQYTQFFELDSAFSIRKSIILPAEITAFDTIHADRFLIATTDSLYVLTTTLEILKAEALPSANAHFVFSTAQYYWTADKGTNRFYKLDTTLAFLESYPLDETISIKDVMTFGDTVFISGNYFHINQSIAFLQTTGDAFTIDLPTDAGVVKMRLTEQAISYNLDWTWFGWPLVSVNYGPVHVTMRNYGMTPIDDVYIRFQDDACPSYCGGLLQYQWHLTGLDLLPGQSIERSLGHLILNCTLYDISTLCMYTIHPNGEPDINFDNNSHCIQVDVISAVVETTPGSGISAYPNPASECIYLDYSDNVQERTAKIALINSNGRQVWRNPDHEFTSRIPLDDIPPGMYFLLIQFGSDQPVMEKIVVL